jgi:guanidinopropionase
MDKANLERLRRKYGSGGADDIHDPAMRKLSQALFDAPGRRKLPYGGVPTLLDAPHKEELSDLDIALIGVPMDLGVTNRPGARFGPRALRAIERIGPYNHVLKIAPSTMCRVADVGDVPFRGRFDLESSLIDIETFFTQVSQAGIRPLAVGGDHSITYPILKALGRERPVGLVHFDAHCDTGGAFDGSKFHHGGPFRLAVLDGVLDPRRTIQIGIRGAAELLWEFSYDSGMTVIHIEEVAQRGVEWVIAKARDVVGDGPVYVSFDVDGLDPAFAPGTGTPEAGGLTPREAQAMLRGLKGLNIVGGDVVEVAPQYDATTTTAIAGAQMLFEIFCLMALAPAK